jgi:hypothetical protein
VTIITPAAERRRLHPVAARVYVVPIVRELPVQPPDDAAAPTW